MVKKPNIDRNFTGGRKMKYESNILKTIHQNAITEFQLGLISEAEMREYDELCLANPKKENKSSSAYANDNSVNIVRERIAASM